MGVQGKFHNYQHSWRDLFWKRSRLVSLYPASLESKCLKHLLGTCCLAQVSYLARRFLPGKAENKHLSSWMI